MKPVSHCIFDMDGLLLDTEHIYENIIRKIAKSYGHSYPLTVRMKILGTSEIRTCEIAVRDLKLPCTVENFHERYIQMCLEDFEDVYFLKGAERLIRHLHEHRIPICVATSSGAKSVAVKTKHHREIFSLFDHKVMGSSDDEVKDGKPFPDIFLVAAKRFSDSPHPENCLVFEDAPNGVKAANSAGMQVVMVPESYVTEAQRENATMVLESLLDFSPEDFGLPPFKNDA